MPNLRQSGGRRPARSRRTLRDGIMNTVKPLGVDTRSLAFLGMKEVLEKDLITAMRIPSDLMESGEKPHAVRCVNMAFQYQGILITASYATSNIRHLLRYLSSRTTLGIFRDMGIIQEKPGSGPIQGIAPGKTGGDSSEGEKCSTKG